MLKFTIPYSGISANVTPKHLPRAKPTRCARQHISCSNPRPAFLQLVVNLSGDGVILVLGAIHELYAQCASRRRVGASPEQRGVVPGELNTISKHLPAYHVKSKQTFHIFLIFSIQSATKTDRQLNINVYATFNPMTTPATRHNQNARHPGHNLSVYFLTLSRLFHGPRQAMRLAAAAPKKQTTTR